MLDMHEANPSVRCRVACFLEFPSDGPPLHELAHDVDAGSDDDGQRHEADSELNRKLDHAERIRFRRAMGFTRLT